jgi:hypothetical protein
MTTWPATRAAGLAGLGCERVPALGVPGLGDPGPLQDKVVDPAVGERGADHHTQSLTALPAHGSPPSCSCPGRRGLAFAVAEQVSLELAAGHPGATGR